MTGCFDIALLLDGTAGEWDPGTDLLGCLFTYSWDFHDFLFLSITASEKQSQSARLFPVFKF